MSELVLTTFDWVPEIPRGYVRDVRVRWALEGAGPALSRRGRAVPRSQARPFRAPAVRPGAVAALNSLEMASLPWSLRPGRLSRLPR